LINYIIMLRFISTLFVVSVYAYQQDLAKLPNGKSYGLTLGHPGGATKRVTSIASTFYGMGQTWNKAFCQADADGDGQSNGLEMGDPCCRWSVGQEPQFITGLSDPNSAASKTLNAMPPCITAFADAKLQCSVCIQALQLDMAKPSDNAVEFSLTSVKACKDATQDDAQKLLCVKTFLKNADQLVKDQMNGVAPIQSCMNLGLLCMAPPTVAPTKPAPTTVPTAAPTTIPTTTPTTPPKPTAPPPPRVTDSMLPGRGTCACGKARITVASCDSAECFEACDKKNLGHGVCTTLQVAAVTAVAVVEPTVVEPVIESSIIVPIVAATGGAIILSLLLWRYSKGKEEVLLDTDGDFQALPDIEYTK
jgi:hypothetical protein